MSDGTNTKPEDWKVEVPELVRISNVINKHAKQFDDGQPIPKPDHNDELEVFGALLGTGRWIELNTRIAAELGGLAPNKDYAKVRVGLQSSLNHYQHPPFEVMFDLLHWSAIATDGLGHGNLPTVLHAMSEAYARHPDLLTRRFPTITLANTTITRYGLNLDMSDPLNPTAKDSQGKTIDATAVKPRKQQSYEQNIRDFYQTAMFVNMFELLNATAPEAVKLREEIRRGALKPSQQ